MPYAVDGYVNETRRLYRVLDRHLETEEFMTGDYSIADIASWPRIYCAKWTGIDLHEMPNLAGWFDTLSSRPAVQRGLNVPEPLDINQVMKDAGEIKNVGSKWAKLLGENNSGKS